MIAVFVNCAAVLAGCMCGILFARKISAELSGVISTGAGVVTLVLGMQMAFNYRNVIFLAVSVILGGIIGFGCDIDGKILGFGKLLERKLYHRNVAADAGSAKPSFAYAFLNASVLFCVGAMSIIGSFQAAIEHNYTVIFTKSVLDGFLAIVFGAAMGIGTAFSVVSIFLYQGSLTLLSGLIAPFVTEELLAEITGAGGVLIVMIGINLIGMTKIKTANYLPALVVMVLLVFLKPVVQNLFLH